MDSSSAPLEGTNDRRTFLQQMMGAGVVMAGTSLLAGCATAAATTAAPAGAAAAGRPAQPATQAAQWDMSWTRKLGKYKTAYDSPQIEGGAGLQFAASAMSGYKAAYNTTTPDFTPVIILRHAASVMTLNDAMWERLSIGTQTKLKDPATGEPNTKRNPFITFTVGDKNSYIGPDSSITALMAQGAIIMACNKALSGVAFDLKGKEPTKYPTFDAALQEIRRNVIPGVFVMPNGVFAVAAAQDAGCNYMRVLT